MADINTLIEDVYSLFDPTKGHVPDEENLEYFAETLKQVLRTRLAERVPPDNPLRFSSLGRKDRQIYLDAKGSDKEELTAKTYFKFLYGDVIEAMLLFLVKEAGHTVEEQQAEVEVNGVLGHIDAIIDGYVVDVKSASPHGFKKFATGSIFDDDPFGYVQQLSGYASVLTPDKQAYWLSMEKVSGDLCLTPLPTVVINNNKPEPRIEYLKELIQSDTVPNPCYEPVADGKSGNMKLQTGCTYCGHVNTCWPNARVFLYSAGPRWLTQVSKIPDVPERTRNAN